MSTHNFKCTNLANCDTALSNGIIEIEDGEDQLCPECKGKLVPCETAGKETPWWVWVSVAAVVLIVLGLGGYLVKSGRIGAGKTQHVGISVPTPTAPYPCGLEPVQSADVARLLQYLKQGMNYASQRKPDLALAEFQQVLKIDPNFLGAEMNIGSAYLVQDKYPEAEASFTKELKLIGCLKQMNEESLARFAYMEEVGSHAAEKQQMQSSRFRSHLNKAEANAHYNLACLNSRRSLKGPALAELEKAISGGLIDRKSLQADPDLKGIRATDEFKTLLARYNPPSRSNP